MNEVGQTWHYCLVARHWAENNATGPEIAFYRRMIERYGQPVLDAGCGTGWLLIPFLRAGLDVDGCDVSEDMLAYCQQAAEREGFALQLPLERLIQH
jgi:2-polyprenyl-3-methyl-5-hydroxy-6-metoxy-1,4-benzoquinol methylase